MIKKIIKFFVPDFVLEKLWQLNGTDFPVPHVIKRRTIRFYARKYGISTLVETGTFMGDMVHAQKNNFLKIITIELDGDLFNKAKERFESDKHISVFKGDSGVVLPEILKEIYEPVVFWLDGHYSEGITAKGDKNCPILKELDAILSSTKYNHVLLIDDARLFVGKNDYPPIEVLTNYVRSKNSKYQVEVKNDIIRYVI